MTRVVSLLSLFFLGCAAAHNIQFEESDFRVSYMDFLRPTQPGVRVKPNFKWAESKYLSASFLERSSILKKIAINAAHEYCHKKGKKAVLGTMYTSGEMVLEDPREQRPISLDADFSCTI